ncbi:MAG: DUF2752 domain-containing protein [Clostridia bacterium]|nr:DUF2752 domain-containing protein [Clostridia bacterium]
MILLIFGAIILLGFFPCPIYGFVGVPCPTCGMTRAWRLFLELDIRAALRMHPLFFVPLVFLLPQCRKRRWVISAIILFAAVYVVRMLLQFPGEPPMNYNYDSVVGGFFR